MKRILRALIVTILMALLLFSVSACSKDDSKDTEESKDSSMKIEEFRVTVPSGEPRWNSD